MNGPDRKEIFRVPGLFFSMESSLFTIGDALWPWTRAHRVRNW